MAYGILHSDKEFSSTSALAFSNLNHVVYAADLDIEGRNTRQEVWMKDNIMDVVTMLFMQSARLIICKLRPSFTCQKFRLLIYSYPRQCGNSNGQAWLPELQL